jgi:aminopeptidase N
MKMKGPLGLIVSAAFVTIAAFCSHAQSARADFNRPQAYDAEHYKIAVSFDRQKKLVRGDTTVTLRPLANGFRTAEFDAVDLNFSSVTLEPAGAKLSVRTAKNKAIVTLDREYGTADSVSIRFRYTAVPKKGIYFVDGGTYGDGMKRSAQIWTQGEPDEARHWFPSFDFPSDKATTEQLITAMPNETVVGNGELVEKIDNPDSTVTWHYRMPVPHSTYLVSFVIGEYVKITDEARGIPLAFYVYPGKEGTGRKAFGQTGRMLAVFEDLTGVKFPFNKYDQTIVSSFQFGGMENITATTMADTEIFFADFEFGQATVTDLVSHELAHSWFGNLVTCRNWAELWLNEGFATFMEAAYREKAFGRGSYMAKIRSDAATFLVDDTINRRRHALFNRRADDVGSLFDNASTTYNKGGAVVHMLREQLGDDTFWKGVNLYLNRHKLQPVESTDLRDAMQEASGQDLRWFFDQWVYGAGAPSLTIQPTYNRRSKSFALTVSQTQLNDRITPGVFQLPLSVRFRVGSRVVNEKLDVRKRSQTFTFTAETRPSEIEIDPDERIVLKKVKLQKMRIAG